MSTIPEPMDLEVWQAEWDAMEKIIVLKTSEPPEFLGYCPVHGVRDTHTAGWVYIKAPAPSDAPTVLLFDHPRCAACGEELQGEPRDGTDHPDSEAG
jgi:hypothetical protein